MIPPLAALACFWYTARRALQHTGFERAMFAGIAALFVVLFAAIVASA